MAPRIPPLPNRPLEVRGHGVWDPVRQAFYPFFGSVTTLPAKKGIRYFVHYASCAYSVTGIVAASYGYGWKMYTDVEYFYLPSYRIAQQTEATDYASFNFNAVVGVLTASGKAVTVGAGICNIVYAEIPDDPAGDLQ